MLYRISNGSITLGNKTILECINFEVKNQEHVCIVGRNGIGKTTLLRARYKEVELEKGIEDKELYVTEFPKEKIGYIMVKNVFIRHLIIKLSMFLVPNDEMFVRMNYKRKIGRKECRI